jgi:hypothetical protein
MSVVSVLALLLVGARGTQAATIGHLVLKVRGNVDGFVLVDPHGRADRDSTGVPRANIPGCARWPGGIEEDEEDASGGDSKAPDLMVFEMDSVEFGRYVFSAHAARRVVVTMSATFDSKVPGLPPCVDLTRSDRVGIGRQQWLIDVRRSAPNGECAVRIAPLVRGKTVPRQSGGGVGSKPPAVRP